jgi:hypothetical protein
MKNPATLFISASSNRNKLKSWCSILLLFFTALFAYHPAQAQVHAKVNIESQSLWGPAGYDYVEYYYLPEIEVYYSVPKGEFIYWNGNRWEFAINLPPRYHVDLYHTYKVIINEPTPYLHNDVYRTKYSKFRKGGHSQLAIRDSYQSKYFVVKGHRNYNQGRTHSDRYDNNPSTNRAVYPNNMNEDKHNQHGTDSRDKHNENNRRRN